MELVILDKALYDFIKKYSFISDPIFLFNPKSVPENLDFSSGVLDLEYPLIEKAIESIGDIENEYKSIIDLFGNTSFEDVFIKNEYEKRIKEIGLIIEIIKHFYDEDETNKFELITKYFGVDLDFCKNEVLKNENIILDEFNSLIEKSYLFDDVYEKIKDRIEEEIDASGIKKYFDLALEYLKIDKYWQVEISDNVFAIVHGDFTKNGGKIFIPSNKVVKFRYLFALIIHEIDGHSKQFTNMGNLGIFKANIRFSNSEEIAEGLAFYLENLLNVLIFRRMILGNSLYNFNCKLKFVFHEINFNTFLNLYKAKSRIRNFRGFRNIDKFINTKDLIYIQGLYKIIKYKNSYGEKLFEFIYDGVINEKYLFSKFNNEFKNLDLINLLKKSSSFYVLEKYFLTK